MCYLQSILDRLVVFLAVLATKLARAKIEKNGA